MVMTVGVGGSAGPYFHLEQKATLHLRLASRVNREWGALRIPHRHGHLGTCSAVDSVVGRFEGMQSKTHDRRQL